MVNKFDGKIVLSFYEEIRKDDSHRYKSWEHCYKAFSSSKDSDLLCLNIAFYLASWGMYRGSSGLLQKDYTIHNDGIKILQDTKYKELRCNPSNEVSIDNVDLIVQLKEELKTYYEKIPYTRNSEDKKITGTDTLISKLILGTLACVPAYDRFFNAGLRIEKINETTFSDKSLLKIFEFINANEKSIKDCQSEIHKSGGKYYPVMKIIDMYFWKIGFDSEVENGKKLKQIESQAN